MKPQREQQKIDDGTEALDPGVAPRPTFIEQFGAEWRRLNPRYVRDNDGFARGLAGGMRAAAIGYFAPLRLLAWLVVGGWRSQ